MLHNSIIFRASLDSLSKGITIGISMLFVAIIGGQLIPSYSETPEVAIVLSTFLFLVYFLCLLFRPVKYSLNSEEIVIHRPFRNLIIKLEDVKDIRQVSGADMKWTIRRFGVGGLFGYFGKFSNASLGSITLYATRRTNVVLIETTAHKKLIVTPDEPALFVKRVMVFMNK